MAKLARLPIFDRSSETGGKDDIRGLRTRFYAFLSYSHQDKALADWLQREIERFKVPSSLAGKLTGNGVVPRRLSPIFRDEPDLSAGVDLAEGIKAALAASQFLIVLCSPGAAKSRWTNQEIESFKRTRPEGCVLAAVAAGEPFASDMPGREDEECFPPALRYKYDRRGHQTAKRAEPLAADFRGSAESRRLALLKLVAGMLGVGLDELVQRDQTRRHRHLAWLAAASLAGMAMTSTLAVIAWEARNSAREQRREAEGLVAFMLGDLKDKLEPIGRLDALDGVGSKVLTYYSRQDQSELTDAALSQRSKALSLTGQVAYLRGNYLGAASLYTQATAGTAEIVRRRPDDPERVFDHAQNIFWVGELARHRGQIDQAEAEFREYGRLAAQMVTLAPDNMKYRMEVQYSRENLGIVLMSKRRFAEAAGQFSEAMRAMDSMVAVDLDNREYRGELANILGWLSDAQKALGHFGDAIAVRQRQIAYLNSLISNGNSGVAFQQQLIPAHQALGSLFASKGRAGDAVAEYRLASAQADRLIAVEPNNSLWKDMGASVRLELAKSLLSLGQRDEAAQQAAVGCNVAANLRDPTVASWRTLRMTCLEVRTRLATGSGDHSDALKLAEETMDFARSGSGGDPVMDRYTIAHASRLLGDVRASSGDRGGALTAWTAGLNQLPSNVTERPWETNERAELLRRTGRAEEARPLSAHLAEIGYHSTT